MTCTALRSMIATIAREELGLRTLDLRGRDDLDFHDLHVGRIERALTRAYRAGMRRTEVPDEEGDP